MDTYTCVHAIINCCNHSLFPHVLTWIVKFCIAFASHVESTYLLWCAYATFCSAANEGQGYDARMLTSHKSQIIP